MEGLATGWKAELEMRLNVAKGFICCVESFGVTLP